MFKCYHCKKELSSRQRLQYHIKKNVCKIINSDFYCSCCDKYYKTKFTLLNHLNLKHSKKIMEYKNKDKKKEIIKKNKIKCQYCNKEFKRYDSLTRHIEKYCKKKNGNTTIINNITTNNIQNNIFINNFGNESLKSINEDNIIKCINRCYSCIPELFKLIHIDTPENRNLYLSNMKDSYLYLYKNNKWEVNDLDKILQYIKDDKKDLMEEYYNKNIDKFHSYKKKNICKMINDYNKGLLNKQYDKKLKMMLVSNKDILKSTYKVSKI
jgi:hypothetical protein